VVAVRKRFVAAFVTVTVELGTTAPEASLIVPEMRPTLVCALAPMPPSNRQSTRQKARDMAKRCDGELKTTGITLTSDVEIHD
jgi:hypothetical protein